MRSWNKKRKPKHHTKIKYFFAEVKSVYCRDMKKRLKVKKSNEYKRAFLKAFGAKEKTIRYVHLI